MTERPVLKSPANRTRTEPQSDGGPESGPPIVVRFVLERAVEPDEGGCDCRRVHLQPTMSWNGRPTRVACLERPATENGHAVLRGRERSLYAMGVASIRQAPPK